MNFFLFLKNKLMHFLNNTNSTDQNETYRIIAVDDSYENTGKVVVKIQVMGMNKTFNRPINELYTKEWLDKFSKEDVAHIAALYTAEQTNNLDLIKQLPQKTPATRASIVVVGILFTSFLILSNLTAFKISQLGSFMFPAGLIFFPVTYIFDDILTEVYGFKVSRRVIWTALLANLIIVGGTFLTIHLKPAPLWHYQAAYSVIYQSVPRIFLASIISYIAGEFTNSIILAKLKILTSGRYLWLRAFSSTAVGVGIDTVLFAHIAFLFLIPWVAIWKIIGTMYLFKVAYETCAVPLTYAVANYLKRIDNIDHYDFNTRFNPFSFQVD